MLAPAYHFWKVSDISAEFTVNVYIEVGKIWRCAMFWFVCHSRNCHALISNADL